MNELDFDKIIKEVSWKLPDGIVDFNNNKTYDALREVLKEMNYDSNFIDEYLYELKAVVEKNNRL